MSPPWDKHQNLLDQAEGGDPGDLFAGVERKCPIRQSYRYEWTIVRSTTAPTKASPQFVISTGARSGEPPVLVTNGKLRWLRDTVQSNWSPQASPRNSSSQTEPARQTQSK